MLESRAALGLGALLLAACGRAPNPVPAGSASALQVMVPPTASAPVVAAQAAASASAPSFACTELPLLEYYQASGAVLEHTPTHLKLHLLINLHASDCPAPDATGDNLVVDLALEPEGEHCWVRSGSVHATPFGLEYDPQKDAWQDELRPDGAIDLASADPSDAVLRAVTTPRAVERRSRAHPLQHLGHPQRLAPSPRAARSSGLRPQSSRPSRNRAWWHGAAASSHRARGRLEP